jgi:hypothetical protein
MKDFKVFNDDFDEKVKKILDKKSKKQLDNSKSIGSQVVLFLEYYRRLAYYAQKYNYQEKWLNDYCAFTNMPNFSHIIQNEKLNGYVESGYISSFESNFLNWEFYREKLSTLLMCEQKELMNPHEPIVLFYQRGGWVTFSNGIGFNLGVGKILIKKPKIEDLLNLPPFITMEDITLEKADKEYQENAAEFMKKIPHKSLTFSHGHWFLNVGLTK